MIIYYININKNDVNIKYHYLNSFIFLNKTRLRFPSTNIFNICRDWFCFSIIIIFIKLSNFNIIFNRLWTTKTYFHPTPLFSNKWQLIKNWFFNF